jgi:AhpD family alkylhydroperoxidase
MLPEGDGNEIARALSYDPVLMDAFRAMSDATRGADLDPRLHEIVRMRIAQLNGCVYCQAFREPAAAAAGVTDALLDTVERWRDSSVFTPAERAALDYTEHFVLDSTAIDDAQFAQLHAHFDDRAIVLLTAAIAKYLAWGRFVQVLGLQQSCAITGVDAAPVFTSG